MGRKRMEEEKKVVKTSVSIAPDLDDFAQMCVESHEFASKSHVINVALKRMRESMGCKIAVT